MDEKAIMRLAMLVKSSTNNLDIKYQGAFDDIVEQRCKEYCNEFNINITHGSAYKELRHKMYYYKKKFLKAIKEDGIDLYNFRHLKVMTDKEIVDSFMNKGE